MKKSVLILYLSMLSSVIFAQSNNDTVNIRVKDVNLDMLKSPTNPAFLLMNTSPTEIAEPGSAPEFYTSVQNASNNFSAIPNNYGFSVTPFWWTKKAKELSFQDDFKTRNVFTFCRTTSLSGGIVKGVVNDDNLWRYGIGFQTTLLRGKIDKSKKDAYLKKLKDYNQTLYGDINAFYIKFPEYNLLEAERIKINSNLISLDSLVKAGVIDAETAKIKRIELYNENKAVSSALNSIKDKLGEKFDKESSSIESTNELDKKFNEMNERKGLKWDIGAGLAFNSNHNKIDSTGIYRAGFWSDFGGNIIAADSGSLSDLSAFLLVRYLYYDKIYYDKEGSVELLNKLHTIDLGAKVQYEIANKFTLGLEAIYRLSLTNSLYENTYKINGLVQYKFGKNKLVYASLGNNFNDNSNAGPEDLMVTFGINLGFGGNIDIYKVNF
jgi:hypothetical protein